MAQEIVMTFDELLSQITDLLQRQGRVSYGALKRRYSLDEAYLQDLKDELIDAQQIATDEDGKVLVWTGTPSGQSSKPVLPAPVPQAQVSLVEGFKVQGSSSLIPDPRPLTPDPQSSNVGRGAWNVERADGERRQLTVMFCDLAGSTALSSQLDPEELRFVVQQYQEVCAKVIERYEGYIAQYLGDGVLAYFGYPTAHEDDARRAVLAGLDIIQSLQKQSLRLNGVSRSAQRPPHARIGIHTGLVVIGKVGGGSRYEQLALGETPNLAARLQELAEPDTVVLSAMTHRLVAGYFVCRSLGEQSLKGLALPLEVYQVLEQSSARHRLEIIAPTRLTPVVGRDEEIEFLLKCWEHARDGQGQVVLLSGEAGIGKSRVIHTLKERIDPASALRLEARCSSYQQNKSLHPMIEFLQRSLSLRREDSPETRLAKLERALTHSGMELSATAPFFASLLALPSTRFPLPELTPQKLREKTHQAMLLWLLKSTEARPVLSVWEDLHWADPSTLEWLGLLIEQVVSARLLVVLTFRPEFVPPWPSRSHLRPLMLNRLTSNDVETMIGQIAKRKTLPAEVVEQLVTKTDGVPLFVEESTKMMVESGLLQEQEEAYALTGPLPPLAIPATLQDSLFARLDRLGAAREVAQIGAACGREFSSELIRAITSLDEPGLHQALGKLVDAEVLYPRGSGRQLQYVFKHALIQDAAYQSLLRSKRQQYHQQIAYALETQFPETKETEPELLAYHYTEAGLGAQAVPYWQKAGQAAVQRSANTEAINHLRKALDLLPVLPESGERAQLELALQTTLGVPLMATKGYAAPEIQNTYARAHALCRQIGETPQLFPVLSGLFAFYLVQGKLRTARALAEQCLRLAENVGEVALLIEAHRMMGNVLHFLGELPAALHHSRQVIALYDREQHHRLAYVSGQDPGVVARSFAAWSLWSLGYGDQARACSREAVVLAQQLGHTTSLVLALDFAANLHNGYREWQEAQALAEAALQIADEQDFSFWWALGTFHRGIALANQGRLEEGIALIQRSLASYEATGAGLVQSGNLAILGGLYGAIGRAEEGLPMLDEAFVVNQNNDEQHSLPQLYIIKGGLMLQSNRQEKEGEAEKSFYQAIEIARQQGARLFELRAAIPLARLWGKQGKRKEAHKLLSDIYSWFTEGFDTPDLKDARVLLEALA